MPVAIVKSLSLFATLIIITAIISYTFYRIVKLNHSKEIEKEKIKRKRDILEEVSSRTSRYAEIGIRYITYIQGIVKSDATVTKNEIYETVEKLQNDLVYASEELKQVDAMLVLAGCNLARRKLMSFVKGVLDITSKFFHGEEYENLFNIDELSQNVLQTMQKRDAFFIEMSKNYENVDETLNEKLSKKQKKSAPK